MSTNAPAPAPAPSSTLNAAQCNLLAKCWNLGMAPAEAVELLAMVGMDVDTDFVRTVYNRHEALRDAYFRELMEYGPSHCIDHD